MNDLRRLGLLRTAEDLNDILARATRLRWSPTVLLEHIVTAELEERRRRSIERRLTAARLGRSKPIADWDWDWPTARCFRHQLLLPSPYLVLTKPLRLDIQCQRAASVKIGWKYLDD